MKKMKELGSLTEERERIKKIKKTNIIVYSAIIKVGWHYSSIGKIFTILDVGGF